jgi:N-acetylglucosamine kinase-like BadF-type ATPase
VFFCDCLYFLTFLFISQAKNKVGQAKSKSANATRQVEKALDDVQAIIEELNQLPNIGKMLLYIWSIY